MPVIAKDYGLRQLIISSSLKYNYQKRSNAKDIMDETIDAANKLMRFGLTRVEARLYAALIVNGRATGYEIAKSTGISRPNAYAGLASLVEKGAALDGDGKPVVFQATPLREFAGNLVRRLARTAEELERELAPRGDANDGYLTIRGRQNIADKILNMITATNRRMYLSMPAHELAPFVPAVRELARLGRKVAMIVDKDPGIKKAAVHIAPRAAKSVRIVADSTHSLTASLESGETAMGLYSGRKHFADLLKDSIKNDIALIENGLR